jgi:quercetin dioxygenase-like cupin family protein
LCRGGGVNKGAAPGELIYYGLTGSLRVKTKSEEYILEPGDTIYIPAGEEREFQAIGSDPTTIIVVFSPNRNRPGGNQSELSGER